jgi:hypothetical protein
VSEDREPDIEVRSSVRGRRLRFEAVPDVRIDLTGDQADTSTSGSERENLPDRVEPHVTYTDVRIDHAILSWLDPPEQ